MHIGRGACMGYDEIRSMSERCASYWNAFLLLPQLHFILILEVGKRKRLAVTFKLKWVYFCMKYLSIVQFSLFSNLHMTDEMKSSYHYTSSHYTSCPNSSVFWKIDLLIPEQFNRMNCTQYLKSSEVDICEVRV